MGPSAQGDVTFLLNRAAAGDKAEYERLAELVYSELRRIATKVMLSEPRDHTLQPTVVATEAYLKLVDHNDRTWQNRAHFFAAAAQSMRRILVDYGRKRRSLKRGGAVRRVDLDVAAEIAIEDPEVLLALDEALTRLEKIDARQSRIVELRYFSGLTEEETAEALDVSVRTVKRDWSFARCWLYAELTREASDL